MKSKTYICMAFFFRYVNTAACNHIFWLDRKIEKKVYYKNLRITCDVCCEFAE